MSPILDLQRRQRELGRIRMGDKGAEGHPQKLESFRLTSASRVLLEHAAALWGGEVQSWSGAPNEGTWELYTGTSVLPIIVPPGTDQVSQFMEQWTAGGCTHRCDTRTNFIDDSPCSCDPDNRACKVTTRINLMLPDLPDVGVWRLETRGWNAAMELPGTIDVIQMASTAGKFLEGRLRIDHRVSKSGGETRRFIVPVIDLDVTVAELLAGDTRPAIGPGGANGGAPPRIPERVGAGEAPARSGGDPRPGVISESQRRRLFAIAKRSGVAATRVKEIVRDVTGQDSTSAVTTSDYAAVVSAVEASTSEGRAHGDEGDRGRAVLLTETGAAAGDSTPRDPASEAEE